MRLASYYPLLLLRGGGRRGGNGVLLRHFMCDEEYHDDEDQASDEKGPCEPVSLLLLWEQYAFGHCRALPSKRDTTTKTPFVKDCSIAASSLHFLILIIFPLVFYHPFLILGAFSCNCNTQEIDLICIASRLKNDLL